MAKTRDRVKAFLPGLAALLLVAAVAGAAELPVRAPAEAEALGIWEASLDADPGGANPFDPDSLRLDAEVRAPGDEIRIVPCFWGAEFSRAANDGAETITPAGSPGWRCRVSPRRPGPHAVRFLLIRGGGEPKAIATASFLARPAPPGAAGFARVDRETPSRFRDDAGPWFALGKNVAWTRQEEGVAGFERYFDAMRDSGQNLARVWLCTWSLGLETPRPFAYDLAAAWRVDELLRAAGARGVRVQLCLDNFYDFRHHFALSPQSTRNGGPCARPADFFALPAARTLHRAKLRYAAARWAAFSSLFAWELWNEQDLALRGRDVATWGLTEEKLAGEWHRPWVEQAAEALRSLDPDRPVTTSLGMQTVWPALWRSPALDFVQIHTYVHYLGFLREPVELDEAALILEAARRGSAFGKPVVIGEYGFLGEGKESSMNARDPEGILLRNGLWAGAFAGIAGGPMPWWWDNWIAPRGLDRHAKALSAFLRETKDAQTPTPMRIEDDRLRVLALRGPRAVRLWVQDRESSWHARIERRVPPRRLSGAISLSGFPPGRWRLRWFDTAAGTFTEATLLDAPEGALRLDLPPFLGDAAACLTLEETP